MDKNLQEGAGRPLYINAPQSIPAAPVKPPFAVTPAELWAALGSYLIGFFYIQWVFWNANIAGGWLAVFAVAFCAGVEIFCRAMGHRRVPAESWFWLACLGAVAVSFALWGSVGATVGGWDILALHGLAVYWTLIRTGSLSEGGTGPMLVLDLARGFLLYPFGGFFLRIRTLLARIRRTKPGSKGLTGVGLGLVAAIPLLAIAYQLLAAVDGNFAALIRFTIDWNWLNGELVLRLILSLPVGAWLYGLVASCLRARPDPALPAELRRAAEEARVLPASTAGVLLAALNGLYLAFFLLQGSYLLGGFFGRLPAGFTAAEYAVSGFGEVCRLMLLNLAVLGGCAKFGRVPLRRSRVLQALGGVLCGFSLLFVAVAAAKLGLYIRRFGLTPRRVLAAWFILVLGAWACTALLTLLRPIRAVRLAVWVTAAAFALLCLSGPDGWIVRGNIALYAHGVVDEIDPDVIGQCTRWEGPRQLAQPLLDSGWMLGRTEEELVDMLGYMGSSGSGTLFWPLGEGRQLIVTFDPSTGLSARAEIR